MWKAKIAFVIYYTVIIFLARIGRIRAVKFRPKNFGRISFDLGEIFPNQQIFRLNNGRNSPNSEEIRPKFSRANLNCANSPGSPKKNSTVYISFLVFFAAQIVNLTLFGQFFIKSSTGTQVMLRKAYVFLGYESHGILGHGSQRSLKTNASRFLINLASTSTKSQFSDIPTNH
jgi:hypothetical protein